MSPIFSQGLHVAATVSPPIIRIAVVLLGFAIFVGDLPGAVENQTSEPEAKVGFIRIIHAVSPGDGKAEFHLDGENLFPKGYELGQATGGIGVVAGSHQIEIIRSGVERGGTQVDVKPGETTTLVGFAETLPATAPGQAPAWRIRILRLRQSSPESGYQLSVVSVCPEEETVVRTSLAGRQGDTTLRVPKFRIVGHPLGRSRAEAFIHAGTGLLTTVSPDSPGNYVVVLYRDARQELRALSFFDPKFVIAG